MEIPGFPLFSAAAACQCRSPALESISYKRIDSYFYKLLCPYSPIPCVPDTFPAAIGVARITDVKFPIISVTKSSWTVPAQKKRQSLP